MRFRPHRESHLKDEKFVDPGQPFTKDAYYPKNNRKATTEKDKLIRAKELKENSIVALVRSTATDATQITDSEVRQMVRDAVELSGGLSCTC